MRWLRRFRLPAVAVTVGLVALVLSMVRAHWSEAPAEQVVVVEELRKKAERDWIASLPRSEPATEPQPFWYGCWKFGNSMA
jgi:hypothetical protein